MEIKAILGLGNTGSKYKNTYHNVGQLMVDFLLENNVLPENVIITKNEGFMNESGNSALKLFKKIGGQPEKLLVIHDDSDIILGKYKLSINRNSAGHKGIEDIIMKIKSKNFWRLRIGIRPTSLTDNADKTPTNADTESQTNADKIPRKSAPRVKAEEFVLKKISKENKEILEKVFEEATAKLINQ